MFADGVMESSSTVGLLDYVLTGPVYNGMTFGQKFADEDQVVFIVQTLNRSKFEIVLGEYEVGVDRKLLRTTILSSSAAGAKIDWQAEDVYYIASFASADVLSGIVAANHDTDRPWWVTFGRWLRKSFPTVGKSTEYFFDGTNDIKLGEVDIALHTYSSVSMPAGAVMLWGGDVAPPGFVLCDGTLLNRTSFVDLFAAIGTKFGNTTGSNFRVPNLKGRVPVGCDPPNTGPLTGHDIDTVGTTGGSHTTAVTFNVTGTTIADTTGATASLEVRAGGSQNTPAVAHTHSIPALDLDLDVTAPSTIAIVQPYLVMNYIISTGGI